LGGAGEVYIFICCFCSHLECGFYTKNMSFEEENEEEESDYKAIRHELSKKEVSQHISTYFNSQPSQIYVHPFNTTKN
jgi:hypothetical protein